MRAKAEARRASEGVCREEVCREEVCRTKGERMGGDGAVRIPVKGAVKVLPRLL